MPKKRQDPRPQNANLLLDTLLEVLKLKNDAAMSRLMEVAPPVISKMRHKRLPVSADFLIRAHDISGLSLNDLRAVLYTPAQGS